MDKQIEYINSIGVLTYTVEQPSITLIPQYYYKQQPPVVKTLSSTQYNAYGWLLGGNNITAVFSIPENNNTCISSLNTNSYKYPLPYLTGSTIFKNEFTNIDEIIDSPILKNRVITTINTNLPDMDCILQGDIKGNLDTLQCQGVMMGYLLNNINDTRIYVSAFVTGTIFVDTFDLDNILQLSRIII